VRTVNAGYRRQTSQVLVREVRVPTRANLDYAAYHANFMNQDPAPEHVPARSAKKPDTSHPFGGALAVDTLTGSLAATPLSEDERRHPLALAPLVELLGSKHVPGADRLEDVAARVRAEDWGEGGGPQLVRQTAVAAYLHGDELWLEVEFAPWVRDFSGLPDEDGDGFPQVYGRVPPAELGADAGELVRYIRTEYAGRVLTPAEVKAWSHQLASYWYPSYNTDLVAPGDVWPDAETEPAIRAELGGATFSHPAVVMRGKPQGTPAYNVFLIKSDAGGAGDSGSGKPGNAAKDDGKTTSGPRLPRTKPSPDPAPVLKTVRAELASHGGSFTQWASELSPLHAIIRRSLAAAPAAQKALAGEGGFLFYRQSMAYGVGGDLGKQKGDRNPVPAIVAFKKLLAEQGVDLLFVPVPTKAEVLPEKLVGAGAGAAFGGKVVNPFQRKLLMELAEKGVETVDLLPLFLRESESVRATLYQQQDTHWTNRGLELAARAVAERVRRYPWYPPLAAARTKYHTKEAPFTRHGDLVSRLPEGERSRFKPEALVGDQVVSPDGTLYEDDPASPVVLLGDSFTGVLQLMDCEHAGVSAHLAKELGTPVDLVMSYGGGPNVRSKLLRRGKAALKEKRLVVWMMTSRDLYDFWEGWQK